MPSIISGNLEEETIKNPKRRGWFIGHFIEPNSVFKNNNFEVKWSKHPKGKVKSIPGANITAKSLSILIKGRFLVGFPDENKEVILSKLGDYVFWDAKVYHTSEALTNSILLTIRWPSIPNDPKPKN